MAHRVQRRRRPSLLTVRTSRSPGPTTSVPVFVVVPTRASGGHPDVVPDLEPGHHGWQPDPVRRREVPRLRAPPHRHADEYTVVFDSGELTGPAPRSDAVSEVASIPGHRVRRPGGRRPRASTAPASRSTPAPAPTSSAYPAPTAPVLNDVVTIGGADFPLYRPDPDLLVRRRRLRHVRRRRARPRPPRPPSAASTRSRSPTPAAATRCRPSTSTSRMIPAAIQATAHVCAAGRDRPRRRLFGSRCGHAARHHERRRRQPGFRLRGRPERRHPRRHA